MSSGNRGEDVAPSAAPPPAAALPLPHELTAEWTVRAQLTFARGGEPVQREYSGQDAVHPVRVVYKWCAPCEEHEPEQEKVSRQAGRPKETQLISCHMLHRLQLPQAFAAPTHRPPQHMPTLPLEVHKHHVWRRPWRLLVLEA